MRLCTLSTDDAWVIQLLASRLKMSVSDRPR